MQDERRDGIGEERLREETEKKREEHGGKKEGRRAKNGSVQRPERCEAKKRRGKRINEEIENRAGKIREKKENKEEE